MTTTAIKTKIFIIRYPVTTYYDVKVVRDAKFREEELLDSITMTELMNGAQQTDCAWDSLKCSWRDGCTDFILDENLDDVVIN